MARSAGRPVKPGIDRQVAGEARSRSWRAAGTCLSFLSKRLGAVRRAIQQQRAIAFGDQEIEQDLALRRQQGGIKPRPGATGAQIIGDQALQEVARLGRLPGR